jgi:glucose/arabinose dehydrogenase
MSARNLAAWCLLIWFALVPPCRADGPTLAGKERLKPLVTGLKNPDSVAIGPDGRIYISVVAEPGKDGTGSIVVLQRGKAVPFATGLDGPNGLVSAGGFLYTTDRGRVLRIDRKGKVHVHVEAKAFPGSPPYFNDIEADTQGNLYVSRGDPQDRSGAVYRIAPNRKVTTLVDGAKNKAIEAPNGLLMASEYHLYVVDSRSGALNLVRLADGQTTKVADGFGGADGLARDHFGRLYVSDHTGGKVYVIGRPDQKPVLLASGFESAADLCLSGDGKSILVPDRKAGALYALPCTVPGAEIDESPLPVKIEVAFPDLQWTGWKGIDPRGKPNPHRPLVLTHAGDGSNRVFVATQHGVIHVFPNDQKAKKTKIFLDIQKRVTYRDDQNEEGFLGLTFAPDYKKSGAFYVYYTPRKEKSVNYLSRFKVNKDDADRADPDSEEVLLKFKKPFWNHDGGTICFGRDGYLYIAVGDGGLANDPFDNAQNLKSLLGKIHRIDVSKKGENAPYAIPKDNPFVKTKSARPEIWAYGLRNVWRMAFDRKTGQLWAADVGQNLWEEINLIERGGNYGWNRREGLHPFGFKGMLPNSKMIEPIWEYHHDVGKSITGGHVYRGERVKSLQGLYLHADYVTGHVWGLRYDRQKKRVTANHLLRRGGFPVFSFGEDEKGEVYVLTSTTTGKGIHWFAPAGS